MVKVLFFGDPGIDDSLAIIYGLLHPQIEIVGIVSGYGNVSQEQATQNSAYVLSLANRLDIPLISGAKGPLSGEFTPYYPEIHGPDGLGPIQPPNTIVGELLNFDEIFKTIERYKNELIIVDVGRLTSLATAFILGGDVLKKVKAFYIMGGAFLIPGNVTPVAEANFNGDPLAANLVMEKANNIFLFPLNVTNPAIVTQDMIEYISQSRANPFTPLIKPIFEYYYSAYKKNVPGIQGAPLHDGLTMSAVVNPLMVQFASKRVKVGLVGDTAGQSIADFRPKPDKEPSNTLEQVGLKLNYSYFIDDFIKIMTRSIQFH